MGIATSTVMTSATDCAHSTPGSPSTRLRIATTGASARPSRHSPKNVARHMRPVVCRAKLVIMAMPVSGSVTLWKRSVTVAMRMTSGSSRKSETICPANANVSTHTHATMPKAALRAKRMASRTRPYRPAP